MNSGDHNIDKLFKDAFDNQEHDFSAAYWQDAHQMLNAGKATPIFTKSYLIIGALSIVISSILFFADSTPKGLVVTNLTANNTSKNLTDINTVSQSNQTDYSNNSTNVINEKYNHKKVNSSSSKKSKTNSLSDQMSSDINSIETAQVEKEVPTSNEVKIEQTNTTPPIQEEKTLKTQQSTSSTIEKAIVANSVIKTQIAIQNNDLSDQNLKSDRSNEVNASTQKVNTLTTPTLDILERTSLSDIFLGSMTSKDLVWGRSNFSLLNLERKEQTELKSIYQPFTLRISIGNLWSESINSSPSNVQTYAQNRNLEVSAEYLFKKNWGIQLGISYNIVQEDQTHRGLGLIDNSYWNDVDKSYWDFEQKQITVNDSTWWLGGWWHYAPYQDTITDSTYVSKYDRVHVTKYDTTDKNFKAKQSIKLIEIPVLLTYNFNKERWNFQIASGMSFGFYSNSNGQIIRPGDPVNLESSSKSLFNSIQYNYLLQTELGYSLTDHWQLNARPQLKMNLNSIYNNSSGFQHRYLFYGINVGLAYRF